MKAQVIEKFGNIDVFQLKDVPIPKVKPGHVVINVKASSINPVDNKMRSGASPLHRDMAPEFPAILHGDVAGIIAEVGSGVTRFKEGDEVYGCAGGFKGSNGALAEFMLADADLIGLKPKSISMVQAAALPLVSITAWEALIDRAHIQGGQSVLIHGATGGVGHMAIQLAKFFGANVFATASCSEKLLIASQLGAIGINYKHDSVAEYVAKFTRRKGFDVVLDTVGGDNLTKSFAACARNGIVSAISTRTTCDLSPLHEKGLSLHVIFMPSPLIHNIGRKRHGEILTELSQIIDNTHIRPLVKQVYPFSQIQQAHSYFESGRYIGKIGLEQDFEPPKLKL